MLARWNVVHLERISECGHLDLDLGSENILKIESSLWNRNSFSQPAPVVRTHAFTKRGHLPWRQASNFNPDLKRLAWRFVTEISATPQLFSGSHWGTAAARSKKSKFTWVTHQLILCKDTVKAVPKKKLSVCQQCHVYIKACQIQP